MVWRSMVLLSILWTACGASCAAKGDEPAAMRRLCVVVGAAGESQYGEQFRTWANRWREGASGFELHGIDEVATTVAGSLPPSSAVEKAELVEPEGTHRDQLLRWIQDARPEHREHWLVLLGHGTHDAKSTRFNLKGPDISATELAKALDGKPGTWVVIVCASSSAPFLSSIAGPNRIVITATKSGSEENFSRFGEYLSQALDESSADLDHDQSLSVLELFLAASLRVQKYYDEQGLLATEQALLDDNGDGRGTPAVFYRGVRAIQAPAEGASLDGSLARRIHFSQGGERVLSQEDEKEIAGIEQEVEQLRKRKSDLDSDTYYNELEILMLKLAKKLGVPRPAPPKPLPSLGL